MYKMVVSDFYGTLINMEEAISLSTMIEIDRIRKDGVLFCIATSKSARIVIDYNRDFPFIDYVVAFNGSYVFDLNKNKAIYNKCMNSGTVLKVYKLFSLKDMCFYTLDCCNYTGRYKDDDFSELLIDTETFIEENKKSIYKIKIFFTNHKEAKDALKLLKDESKIECYLKEENDVYVLEVYSALDCKLSGVEKICKARNIKLKEVLTICSSVSSDCLLKKVGHSCCVANASNKMKKLAKEETLSNEDKGVEHIIKKYF